MVVAMKIGQFFSGVFLLGFLCVAGIAAWLTVQGQDLSAAAGQVWYQTHAGSLNLIQAVVERYVSQTLWDEALFPALLWPTWVLLAGLALVFLSAFGLIRLNMRGRAGKRRRPGPRNVP